MLEQPNVRRRHDGSIDIDFYRQAAVAERRLAVAAFARGVAKQRGGVIAAMMLAIGLYVASHGGRGEASAGERHNSAVAPL